RLGVSDHAGSVTLYTPSYRGYRFDGLAATDEETARGWFPYSIARFRPELLTVATETIQLVRLDDMVWSQRVDFIKLDVQGCELAALRGAERLLVRDSPTLMIEWPDADVLGFLAGLGYRPLNEGDLNVVCQAA